MRKLRLSILTVFLGLTVGTLPAFGITRLEDKIALAAKRASVDPHLVHAIVKVESNANVTARSHKGAMGLMQVMPGTAKELGIRLPYHALNNLMGACQYLRRLINRYRGDLKLALAAYNAGPANVDRYGGIPPFRETQKYVKNVLAKYHRLKKMPSSP